jgi:hypothetical protein
MTSTSSWDASRWRERQYQTLAPNEVPNALDTSRLLSPTAINPATSQSAILNNSYPQHNTNDAHSWNQPKTSTMPAGPSSERRPSFANEQHTPLTEPYTNASTCRNRSERYSPAPGGNYGPLQQLASTSPHHQNSTWRSLQQDDRRPQATHITDGAPLTLHIPKTQGTVTCYNLRLTPFAFSKSHAFSMLQTQSLTCPAGTIIDLPKISPAYNGRSTETRPGLQTPLQSTTSLPSFASLREQADRAEDPDLEGPEIAPMSARLPCYSCTKLKPMVTEVARAIIELDEAVQAHCSKLVSRVRCSFATFRRQQENKTDQVGCRPSTALPTTHHELFNGFLTVCGLPNEISRVQQDGRRIHMLTSSPRH